MTADMRLVTKGKGEPRDGLAQQGKFHVGIALQHQAELKDAGWLPEDTAALAANVASLEARTGAQAKAFDGKSDTTTSEKKALAHAKGYIRRLRNALPRALREAEAPGVSLESFNAGEALGRSTPKIAKYLFTIRPAVVALDPVLQKHFKGKLASAELDQVKSELDAADTAQELARKNAPSETLTLYEMMGKVLEQIEDLNRAGKSAFDGDPTARAKFNKDLLQRARREAKKDAEEEPAAPLQ